MSMTVYILALQGITFMVAGLFGAMTPAGGDCIVAGSILIAAAAISDAINRGARR